MAEVIRMPRMSDTMTEGVFVEWHKKVGDKVKSGDVLAEVETDKATMELESYNNGVLLYIGVEAGKAAPVDSVIAIIGKEGEAFQELLDAAQKEAPAAEKSAEEPVKEEPKKKLRHQGRSLCRRPSHFKKMATDGSRHLLWPRRWQQRKVSP